MSRMMNRLVPILVAGSLVLAACGGGEIGNGDETQPPTDQSPDASPTEAAFPEGDISIEFWTKEGAEQFAYVEALAEDYMAMHDNVSISVVNKDVETLREDLVNTALSPDAAPELVWTVADHVGPFTAADVIQPLDGMVDTDLYDEVALSAVEADGQLWGVPISNGNQLMLYYNKSIIGDEPPADTDEMIDLAVENTGGGSYGFVFNETESFWLVPWIGGFGGQVFAEDGVTPTLDTDAMRGALQFLYDLKYTHQVMPSECDYDCAKDLFLTGDAAMHVNGDWELGTFGDALGDDLGVAPLPDVSDTGDHPKPYTAGSFYMVPRAIEGDTLTVVLDFIEWSTNAENQVTMVEELRRLPANRDALEDSIVTDDPLLGGAAEAVQRGTPQPTNVEMRCVFDAMTPATRDVLGAGNSNIDQVVDTMQQSAENCIASL
jgi:arabinogalactan oligomer / maltooligosaccharide transport system substrate-binding protein